MEPRTMFIIAAVLRIGVTIYGEWNDSNNTGWKYTDIDYGVFSDASREIVEGGSPFDRATYRYTPLLAWMCIPNVWFHSFGKFLFCLVDMIVGWLTYRILRMRGSLPRKAALHTATFLLSPIIINVSTRGNADSLVCCLALAVVYFLMRKQVRLAAIMFGLSVHVKIYPIVYALPLVLFLDDGFAPGDFEGGPTTTYGGASGKLLLASVGTTTHSSSKTNKNKQQQVSAAAKENVGNDATSSHAALRKNLDNSNNNDDTTDNSNTNIVIKLFQSMYSFLRSFLTRRRVEFGIISAASFLSLTAIFYFMYGWTFLYETYVYHLVRTDNRHNFSPYFYDLYLRYDKPSRAGAGLLSFLPQFGTVFALGGMYYKDLPFALFIQTFAFVAFNKVITAQYFNWYLTLLPLMTQQSVMSPRLAFGLLMLWVLTELHWNYWAYWLELVGQAVFFPVWGAGLIFFAANIAILTAILYFHRFSPVFDSGNLVAIDDDSNDDEAIRTRTVGISKAENEGISLTEVNGKSSKVKRR